MTEEACVLCISRDVGRADHPAENGTFRVELS